MRIINESIRRNTELYNLMSKSYIANLEKNKKNKDTYIDIIDQYQIYNVTRDITKEIHKTFISNIRPNIKNGLFNTKISIDFEKAKTDLINFIKLFSDHPEHFDIKEIIKLIIIQIEILLQIL